MPHAADAAMHQDMIPGGGLGTIQRIPGGDGDERQRRGFAHWQVARLERDEARIGQNILGKRAAFPAAHASRKAIDFVARLEAIDTIADPGDFAREIRA